MRLSHYFFDIELLKIWYNANVLSNMHCLQLDRIHRKFLKILSYKLDGTYAEVGITQLELLERHGIESLSEWGDAQCRTILPVLLVTKLIALIIWKIWHSIFRT